MSSASPVVKQCFKDLAKYQISVDCGKYDKRDVMDVVRKMRVHLAWHKKTEKDVRTALEFFDNIHEDKALMFSKMALPFQTNEMVRMKLDITQLLKKVQELCLRGKLNMTWWKESTNAIIVKAYESQQARAVRRQTLTSRATFRESALELNQIRAYAEKKKLVIPSGKRGAFKRVKAYQSVHGVPAWPIGHRKASSMTRVGLELHALRDLQELGTIQKNAELMQELNQLYEKLYELWETLKTRKLAREARALIKHKCSQLNPAQIQADYGCPWAVNEMLEMQQQRLSQNKQFNQIRNLRESVHINSPRMRMAQENFVVEMSNLQRISDSMASDAMQREIKHQKASDIQRKSFQKGMKLKQDLQSKQSQLEMQLEYDDGIIDELELEITNMLLSINKHDINLDKEKLPKFEIFVPIKSEDNARRRSSRRRSDRRSSSQNKENQESQQMIIEKEQSGRFSPQRSLSDPLDLRHNSLSGITEMSELAGITEIAE